MSDKLERYNALIHEAVELLWPEFESLSQHAIGLLETDSAATEAVAVKTASGKVHGFAYHAPLSAWDDSEGYAFLDALAAKGEGRIDCLVCFIAPDRELPPDADVILQPELPSYGFRSRMQELDEKNAETVILLQGGIMLPKRLKATMPPRK